MFLDSVKGSLAAEFSQAEPHLRRVGKAISVGTNAGTGCTLLME